MNKLSKISATALVALFLAACDKPAEKAPVTEPAKKAETTQAPATVETTKPAEATKAPATTEVKPATEAPSAEAIADFQKIVAWNAEQEKALASSQQDLQQKLATQDSKQIQEGLSQFTKKVDEVVKSLESISVSDEQVKTFKEKTKSVLVLSRYLIAEQVKAISAPNDEAIKQSLQQKTQELVESGNELQKLQADLQQRFMAK